MVTILSSRRRWQALAVALASVAIALALAGLRGRVASAGEPPREVVRIVDFAYKPSTLRIGPETEVFFFNKGKKGHTATSKGSFDTGRIKPGKSAGILFKARGTYHYHCTIHPRMKGRIIVDIARAQVPRRAPARATAAAWPRRAS
jgi:plastocyanin